MPEQNKVAAAAAAVRLVTQSLRALLELGMEYDQVVKSLAIDELIDASDELGEVVDAFQVPLDDEERTSESGVWLTEQEAVELAEAVYVNAADTAAIAPLLRSGDVARELKRHYPPSLVPPDHDPSTMRGAVLDVIEPGETVDVNTVLERLESRGFEANRSVVSNELSRWAQRLPTFGRVSRGRYKRASLPEEPEEFAQHEPDAATRPDDADEAPTGSQDTVEGATLHRGASPKTALGRRAPESEREEQGVDAPRRSSTTTRAVGARGRGVEVTRS